ncbi:hypothetical protein Q3G72_033945 [Acer saccharum]|nr:hypothetical protein Q3G72_033945 [Acer saccharum]
MIRDVVEVDGGLAGNCVGKFLRVRVRIDISKPLRRCLHVDILGDGVEMIMLLRKNNSWNFGGMSILNDRNSTSIRKVEMSGRMTLPISALAVGQRNVAEKRLIADIPITDAPKPVKNLAYMKSASINVSSNAFKDINDFEKESENMESKKSATINDRVLAINATIASEGMPLAVSDQGKQVEVDECNPVSMTHNINFFDIGPGPSAEEPYVFVGDKIVQAQVEINADQVESILSSSEDSLRLGSNNHSLVNSLKRDPNCQPCKRVWKRKVRAANAGKALRERPAILARGQVCS